MDAQASTMAASAEPVDSDLTLPSVVVDFLVPKLRIAVRKERRNFHNSRRVNDPSSSPSNASNPMANFSLLPPVHNSEQPDANSS